MQARPSQRGIRGVTFQAKKEATATKPQVARLKRTLEEAGRAPLLLALPLVVPEGLVLLLVLLGDPEPELLEPPGLPELVEVAGGAKEGEVKNQLRQPSNERCEIQLTSRGLDLELGSNGVNVAMVGRVDELNRVTASTLQRNVGDGETLC